MCSELLLRSLGSQTEGTSATPELPRITMLEPASRRSLSTQAGAHSTAPTLWGTRRTARPLDLLHTPRSEFVWYPFVWFVGLFVLFHFVLILRWVSRGPDWFPTC